MDTSKKTLWDRFLSPIIRSLIDEEQLKRFRDSIDWEQECDRFRQAQVSYPEYYSSQNFHGIKNGYLSESAPVTYDPITKHVLPPNESWVRQGLINAINSKPRRILDLGCGTGSTTLMLKQAFPQAEVIGLDLSPYMLVMCDYKAKQAELDIQWRHGNAEATGWREGYFDLVTASLLFHETPPKITKTILHECFRLLTPGGEVIILDGHQEALRRTDWLTEVFEEPYIKDYAQGNLDAWLGAVGFNGVRTETWWLVHQISKGVKPIKVNNFDSMTNILELENLNSPEIPAPAF